MVRPPPRRWLAAYLPAAISTVVAEPLQSTDASTAALAAAAIGSTGQCGTRDVADDVAQPVAPPSEKRTGASPPDGERYSAGPRPKVDHTPWLSGVSSGVELSSQLNSVVGRPSYGGPGGAVCPDLEQPGSPHFLVINLDASKGRLARMRQQFERERLPPFERVPGVLLNRSRINQYRPRRLSRTLPDGDYAVVLAHARAWSRVVDGGHAWGVILEDDTELVPGGELRRLPPVPADADALLLRPGTIFRWAPVCDGTSVSWKDGQRVQARS